jgi:hypothetical protein
MTDFDFDDFKPDEEPEFEANLDTLRQDGTEAMEIAAIVKGLEQEILELNARFRHLTEKRMVYAMSELGIKKFSLDDGTEIKLKEDNVVGSFPKDPERRAEAKEEIERLDASDLIKTELKTSFGKGAHNQALSVAQELRDQGFDVSVDETIHHSTYASWGRDLFRKHNDALERGELGDEPDFRKLGLVPLKKVEVKAKKGK